MKLPLAILMESIRHDETLVAENRALDSAQSTFLDAFYAARFATLLATPFNQWDAYRLKVIDDKGAIITPPSQRDRDQRKSFTHFHRIIWNTKRLLEKVAPGKIASVIAATRMIMESDLSPGDKTKILEAIDFNILERRLVTAEDMSQILAERQKMQEEAPVNQTAGVANPEKPLFKEPLNRRKSPKQVSSLPGLRKREVGTDV